MRTRIKICCNASKDEADQAIAAGADALGLVAKMPPTPNSAAPAAPMTGKSAPPL